MRYTFTLSEADRDALEALRVQRGDRSWAQTILALIHASRPSDAVAMLKQRFIGEPTRWQGPVSTLDVQLGPSPPKPGAMLKPTPKR